SFADARFHSRFWRWYGGSALDELRQLDWREDYWQFGKLLQQIAASIARHDLEENVRSVRWALRELPSQLLRWGGEDQKNTPTPERPNSEYRKKLAAALHDLGARAAGEPVRLLRRDLDPNYRPPLRAAGNPRAGTSPTSAAPGAKRSAPAGTAAGTASTRLRTAVRSLWETRHAKPLLVVGALAVSGVVGFVLRDLPGGTSARPTTPPETVTPAPVATPPAQTIPPQAAAAPVAPPAPVAAGDAAAACWRDGGWVSGCGFAAYAGGPTMRVVGGDLRYRMGSPESEKDRFADEGPQHEVAFARRFALAESETTVAQYLACVEEKACDEPEWRQAGSARHYQTGTDTYYRDRDAHLADRPISGVSWHHAQQYVRWLSGKGQGKYELPSEAMWEYAARGGSTGRWYFGDDESRLAEHAWYWKNAGGKLHAVGTTQRNEHAWGLRDMHGNVWEWVADCWHDDYNGAPGDGRVWEGGDCGRRVLRGGSWNDYAGDARSACRIWDAPGYRNNYAGFRPSRMLP
ncbi:formylglycine-generating enzyme family protein, partial [Accumulibacter sp.]|uniref:formylglycine-generating enzyme family protein n=1 Tax=Accumulibacter sp. TaxID=2053492 RepID=UPI002618C825